LELLGWAGFAWQRLQNEASTVPNQEQAREARPDKDLQIKQSAALLTDKYTDQELLSINIFFAAFVSPL
jgi:hypothetical protein